jgi:hypothetical protein
MPEQGVAIEFDRSDRAPDNKAEIIIHTEHTARHCSAEFRVSLWADPVLSLVVWTLKREVRAIRGCLGMYRR